MSEIVPVNAAPAPTNATPAADPKAGIPAAVQQDQILDVGGEKLPLKEVQRRFELAKGAGKAMQEMDRLKKDYSNFFANFKGSPAEAMRSMMQQGLMTREDAVKVATELYRENVYQPSKMTKEQLAAQEAQRELAALRAEKAKQIEERQKAEVTAKSAQAKAQIIGQLREAFKLHPEIPESADSIRFAAKHKNIAKAAGQNITYEQALTRGWDEIKSIMRKIAESHNEDNIIDYTGEELAEKINKAYLKRLKKKETEKSQPKTQESVEQPRAMTRKQRVQEQIKKTIENISAPQGGR